MANYNVTITDGVGSQKMKVGAYSVTATANGYDATTLSPAQYTATAGENNAAFTISANGTLDIIFNETGAAGGTAVTEGSVVMTDSTGLTQYGSPVSISAEGTAVFPNVPFSAAEPLTLYFVQLSTDATHNVAEGVITVSMDANDKTIYVINSPIATQNFTLTDANYQGLPVPAATLDFVSE